MKRRIVVTGLGAVTPIGIGKEEFWEALVQGKSGVREVTLFDASDYPTRIGAEVSDFNPSDYLDSKQVRRMDRFTQLAMAAAQLALDDARLRITSSDADRVGVIVGSGIGGLKTLEEQHKVLLKKGPRRVSPFLIPMMICNLASGQISIHFGAKGFNSCTVTACASANHAIGEAYETIKEGKAEAMIAGGTEAAITPLSFAGFCSMKALSTKNDEPQKASRPFDALRDGFVMGEGAGILILEELEKAKSRGAYIYCEVLGYGGTGDAYHITAPDPKAEGATKAITMALNEGGVSSSEVDYINAHGTSTPYNDEFETLAIKKALGDQAYKVAVSSTKSMTGHLLGAAGGIEAIATALAIKRKTLPPTINYENPDSECDLDYVPNKARTKEINAALSNSLGFGGHNAVLALKRFD